MAKVYVCQVCGYSYEEVEGDPTQSVPAGTKFEDVDDSWVCPICGVDKSNFSEV